MAALAEACSSGRIGAEVAVVVSPVPDSPAVMRAESLGLAVVVASPKEPGYESALLGTLASSGADLVCLAGLMTKLPVAVLEAHPGRILNVHPALLPKFGGKGMYGRHVHEAVLEYGAKVSGCTVHFADDTYDTGPIVLQRTVEVRDDDTPDTLAARVFAAECEAYPEAIRRIAGGNWRVEGRRVVFRG